jgi:predicted secreted hydrolase
VGWWSRCAWSSTLSAALILGACNGERTDPAVDISVAAALGSGSTEGFPRVTESRKFSFPEDHGPHPDYRNEWWYLTGNLATTGGRRFGYQLTLFRIALSPTEPPPDSAWRTRQIYMGHLAITDAEDGKHQAWDRFSRGAIGLAGSLTRPYRIWLEDWRMEGTDSDLFPLRVTARAGDAALDLRLSPVRDPVLQGDRGLSQKSTEAGNASYYYSLTRLATSGRIDLNDQHYQVEGHSWLDREWSTSALGRDQTGWDWFALQLSDGRDLMFYRLRDRSGGMDPHSEGVLVEPDGSYQRISHEQVQLTPLEYWRSPATTDRYPIAWRLRLPGEGLDLEVRALIPNQEMNLTVKYWEGAVEVGGSHGGRGYLEMTRYQDNQQ